MTDQKNQKASGYRLWAATESLAIQADKVYKASMELAAGSKTRPRRNLLWRNNFGYLRVIDRSGAAQGQRR